MLGAETRYLFPTRRSCIILLGFRLRPDPAVDTQEISQVPFTPPYNLEHKRVNLVGNMLKSIHKTRIIAGMPDSLFRRSEFLEVSTLRSRTDPGLQRPAYKLERGWAGDLLNTEKGCARRSP